MESPNTISTGVLVALIGAAVTMVTCLTGVVLRLISMYIELAKNCADEAYARGVKDGKEGHTA